MFVKKYHSVCRPEDLQGTWVQGESSFFCDAKSVFEVSNKALRLVQCWHLLVFGCLLAGLNFIEPKASCPKQHQLYVNTCHSACLPWWHSESERFLCQPSDVLKPIHQVHIKRSASLAFHQARKQLSMNVITPPAPPPSYTPVGEKWH